MMDLERIKKKIKGIFRRKKVYRTLPLTKKTLREMPEALIKDRARARGDAIKWEAKFKEERRKRLKRLEFDPEAKLREERRQNIKRIIKNGHHFMVFNGKVNLWSEKEEYLGKLISIIRYKNSVYYYVKGGKRKLYGRSGKTMDDTVHYPENLEEQLKHLNLTINFDKRNKYRPQYVIKI